MEGSDEMELENNDVTVLLEPSTYTKSIYKDPTASWVFGLTPEDEDIVGARKQTTVLSTAKTTTVVESTAFRRGVDTLVRLWLRIPILLGLLCLVILLYTSVMGPTRYTLDFPGREEELWEYVATQQEGITDFLNKIVHLWGTSTLFSLFSLTLSWMIGTAAQHFWTVSGVGISLLSFMAIIGQMIMLWMACSVSPLSKQEECDIPFVLYWTFGVIRMGGPLLAVWCVSPVLDLLQSTLRWRIVLGFPVLGWVTCLVISKLHEGTLLDIHTMYVLYYVTTFIVWVPLVCFCFKLKRFQVEFDKKRHKE